MHAKEFDRINKQQHIFSGFLVCGNCGAGMHFKRVLYVCGHQNKHGKKTCPENFLPKENEFIQMLLDDLNHLYFSKKFHQHLRGTC